jgi:aryl-alcohol dehydrogenase-like predicted oxidoreductase
MYQDFLETTLGATGLRVRRLGLSATYRPGKKTIYKALDEGLNFFFFFGIDTQMTGVLRDVLRHDREKYVVCTGAYNLLLGHPNMRRSLEKRLRQLGTDYIDAFLFLGVTKPKHFTSHVREELCRFREEGKVKGIGLSTHHRKFAGELAAQGAVDVLMIRYNAAHRGAEKDIFPFLKNHNPGVVSYTATRWGFLMRRPKGWPKNERIPTAGMSYRFVLSNPDVDVCLTAPSNIKQLEDNIAAFRNGPLSEEDMEFMRKFGDAVHNLMFSIKKS